MRRSISLLLPAALLLACGGCAQILGFDGNFACDQLLDEESACCEKQADESVRTACHQAIDQAFQALENASSSANPACEAALGAFMCPQ